MSTILLTGAAGFIGSETASQLLAAGDTVVGVDNLNEYHDPRLKRHRLNTLGQEDGFRFVEGDIEDSLLVDALFAGERYDAVFNLAARGRCPLQHGKSDGLSDYQCPRHPQPARSHAASRRRQVGSRFYFFALRGTAHAFPGGHGRE